MAFPPGSWRSRIEMRIGINALYLIPDRVGGSEIYLRRLLSALARIDSTNHYVIFTNRENRGSFPLARNFTEHFCPVNALFRPHRILWEQFILPFHVKKERLDVLHSPGFTAPLFCPCPSVVTFLDTIYLEFPETFPSGARWAMKFLADRSASRSRAVIALSHYSRDQIIWSLDVAPDQVDVIHMAPGLETGKARPRLEANTVLNRYGIKYPYILAVSAAHPHKNLVRLIEAYYLSRQEGVDHDLVLMGVKHRRYFQMVRNTVKRLDLEDKVVFTGWVPEEEKAAVYSGADLLVYPSLLEGFGLPVVEAMRLGVPVACSDVPSLQEAAGDAARFFNPHSVEEIAAAIKDCLRDDDLRRHLIARGRSQAGKFSWDDTARRTLEVYRCAASTPGTGGKER